jgi:hypothetical protein
MGETIHNLMEASRAVGFSIAKRQFIEIIDSLDQEHSFGSMSSTAISGVIFNDIRKELLKLEYTPSPATQEDK